MGRGSGETSVQQSDHASAILFGEQYRRGSLARSSPGQTSGPVYYSDFRPLLSLLGLREYIENLDGFSGGWHWLAASEHLPEKWKFKSAGCLEGKGIFPRLAERLQRWQAGVAMGEAVACQISEVRRRGSRPESGFRYRLVKACSSDETWRVSPNILEASRRLASRAGSEPSSYLLLPNSGVTTHFSGQDLAIIVGLGQDNVPVTFNVAVPVQEHF